MVGRDEEEEEEEEASNSSGGRKTGEKPVERNLALFIQFCTCQPIIQHLPSKYTSHKLARRLWVIGKLSIHPTDKLHSVTRILTAATFFYYVGEQGQSEYLLPREQISKVIVCAQQGAYRNKELDVPIQTWVDLINSLKEKKKKKAT